MRASKARVAVAATAFAITSPLLVSCTAGEEMSGGGENTVTEIEAEFGVGETSFEDGTLVSPHLNITITDTQLIQPGEPGNEYGEKAVVAIWYETTNVGGQHVDPLTAWFTHFRAVQDLGSDASAPTELTLGMVPEKEFEQSQSVAIEEGETVVNAVSYTALDTEAPVELVASDAVLNQVGSTVLQLQ